MHQTYKHRYERAPGKWIYVPTDVSIERGDRIVSRVLKRYSPKPFFYHIGKRGGHVAALHEHLESAYFARFDLANFFGNVTRAKVSRALKDIGFSQQQSFNWAVESCVVQGTRKFLPQGFVQSPVLATLVLERSVLGGLLSDLVDKGITVTVYMDDIVLSSLDRHLVEGASVALLDAAAECNFPISRDKLQLTSATIEVFNCDMAHQRIQITADRIAGFAHQWAWGNGYARAAIERYVEAITLNDLQRLHAMVNVAA